MLCRLSDASLYLKGDQDMTTINPRITITAVIPFQIPATDQLTKPASTMSSNNHQIDPHE